MTTPTHDTWDELRSATADRELERALFLALEFEGLEQLAALHYVSREASIETFDPEVMRAHERARLDRPRQLRHPHDP